LLPPQGAFVVPGASAARESVIGGTGAGGRAARSCWLMRAMRTPGSTIRNVGDPGQGPRLASAIRHGAWLIGESIRVRGRRTTEGCRCSRAGVFAQVIWIAVALVLLAVIVGAASI
jgi:hypothetical protein